MKVKLNQLEKHLQRLAKDDKLELPKLAPHLRAFVLGGGECTLLTWPVADQVSFIKKVKTNNCFAAVLSNKPSISDQVKAINEYVQSIAANYCREIAELLPAVLKAVHDKSWMSKDDVLCEETEMEYIEAINVVTAEQIQELDEKVASDFAQKYAKHMWLSKDFEAGDTPGEKLHKAVTRVRKRMKNKIDARKSRKRKATELAESRSQCAKNAELSSAARALQDSAEMHSIRNSTASFNLQFKKAVQFF